VIHVPAASTGTAGNVMSGFRGGKYPESGDPEDVQVHTFRSEGSEADWIAGKVHSLIEQGNYGPEDIMIVSRCGRDSGGPIGRALKLFGIPVQDGFERPLATHPVVRLILDAVRASIHPENEALMSRVQMSNYVGGKTPGMWNPLKGIDEKGWSCRFAEFDTPEGYAACLLEMLEDLNIRENLDGGGDERRALSEIAAHDTFVGLLDEFSTVYGMFRKMMKAGEFYDCLTRFLGGVTLHDIPSEGRGVLVVDVNRARYITRRVVFMTGLDDTRFPAGEPPFTLHAPPGADESRGHRRAEEPLLFYMAAAGAESLFFTFPGIDDEGNDHTMSPYLREICEGIRAWSTPRFHPRIAGAATEAGSPGPRGCAEQVMRALKRNRSNAHALLSEIGKRDVFLERRIMKAIASCLRDFHFNAVELSSHPSFVEAAAAWDENRVFTVTDLRLYLECPIKFFLRRFLDLSVDTTVPGDINPDVRGLLVHEVIARFYRELEKRKGGTRFGCEDLPECTALMREIVDEVFLEKRGMLSGILTLPLISERRFFYSWMGRFLENECRYFEEETFRPRFFEVEFGGGKREDGEGFPPIGLTSDDGAVVLIGGRIDRIDEKIENGSRYVRVIDYKSGSAGGGRGNSADDAGIQLSFYLDAARRMILEGYSIHDGVYYYLRDMEMKRYRVNRRVVLGDDWNDVILEARGKAVGTAAAIRAGRFPLPGNSCPGSCEFLPLCRGGRKVEW